MIGIKTGPSMVENVNILSTIESFLRNVSYLLPARFVGAPVFSEGLYCAAKVMAHVHNRFLRYTLREGHAMLAISDQLTEYVRGAQFGDVYWNSADIYQGHWSSKPMVALAMESVQLIQMSQVFMELLMTAGTRPWRLLVGLELTKAVARGIILVNTRSVCLSAPATSTLDLQVAQPEKQTVGARTKRIFPASLAKAGVNFCSVVQARQPRFSFDSPREMLSLLGNGSRGRIAGEMLSILRPLVYVLLLKRDTEKKWRPFVVALVLEMVSNYLVSCTDCDFPPLELDEHKRRSYGIFYNLLRDPFYSIATRPIIDPILKSLNRGPILSYVGSIIEKYKWLWEHSYFFTTS